MRKFLPFVFTMVFLMPSTTVLAQKQYKCMYCGSRGTSISELAKRKCGKSPDGKCFPIYDVKTPKSKSTKSMTTSSYTTGKSYPSPIKGDTITINEKKYILSSLEKSIPNDWKKSIYNYTLSYGIFITTKYTMPKSVRKHSGEIWDAVMAIWNGIKSGRVEYNGNYFTDYEGVLKNASKKKEDYVGVASLYLGSKIIDKAKPITPRSRTRGYFSYNNISELQKRIDNDNDAFCGIYKGVNAGVKTVACIKSKGEYYLVCVEEEYYHYSSVIDNWLVGDIVAKLERTASANTFTSKTFWDRNPHGTSSYFFVFDGNLLHVAGNGMSEYLKTYPIKSR